MAKISIPQIFLLNHSKGVEIIRTNELIRVEASSNYCWLHFIDGSRLVASKTLQWFEEILTGKEFVRVHRTHLINSHFIKKYIYVKGGKIILMNGDVVDVSRRKKSHFLQSWAVALAS